MHFPFLRTSTLSILAALILGVQSLPANPETQDGKPIDLPYADPQGGRENHHYTDAPVNETRIYDFYQRQAAWYREHPPAAEEVLPAFPGLDGGLWGHSGRPNQNNHVDDSWAKMEVGKVVSCTLRGAGKPIPKALTFQVGEEEAPVTVVFNPETLAFEKYWRGRVRFGDRRWGIVENVYVDGEAKRLDFQPREGEFLGYFIAGDRYFLHSLIGGNAVLEEVVVIDDGNAVTVAPRTVTMEEVNAAIAEAKPRWDWTYTASGKLGSGELPYTVDTIPIPFENPYRSLMFLAGHDFLSNGDAAVSTIMGDIWIVKGIDEGLQNVTWRRFAVGLNQPLGLVVVDDIIHVLCKDRILRLHDTNGDGEADHFENFCNYPTSQGGHDYATDLQRDGQGNFYFSTKHIGTVKVSPDGKYWETLATGIRNPNGIGVRSDGMVVTAPQEGTWTPASMILESRDGRFFGLGAKRGQHIDPPLCYVPRGVDNSTGGQVFVETEQGWGPLEGQLLSLSYGNSTHYAVLIDESTGVKQGAVLPLPGDFLAAPNRGRFSPHDGQLYITGSEGWGDYAIQEGCFHRVRYTGKPADLPTGFRVHANGIALTFSRTLNRDSVEDAANWFAQQWNYQYTSGYGSPEFSVRKPNIIGHDPVAVASAHLLEDGKTVFVELPELFPVMQFHLHGQLQASDGTEFEANLFPTIKRLGERFTAVDGLKPEVPNKPSDLVLRIRWPEPKKKTDIAESNEGRPSTIQAITGLQFDQKRITVKAGEQIRLIFDNTDAIPHNLVLVRPEAAEEIGTLSNAMVTDPRAIEKAYVPEHEGVIAHTAVINGGEKDVVVFDAPDEAGEYPYICTFPGHWLIMRGIMVVEEE